MSTFTPRSAFGPLSRGLTLFAAVALASGLSACAKPAVGTERDNAIVRPANTGSERRLTDAQLKQQERIRQQAAQRRVEIQRGGYVHEAEQKCTSDDECTLVAMHCCSCDYKGQLVGINKNSIPKLAVRRTGVCQTYKCMAQKSDHQSCQAKESVCKAGMCVPDLSGTRAPPAGIGVEPIKEEGAPEGAPAGAQGAPAEGTGTP